MDESSELFITLFVLEKNVISKPFVLCAPSGVHKNGINSSYDRIHAISCIEFP